MTSRGSDPGMEPWSPALQADSLLIEPPGKPITYSYFNLFIKPLRASLRDDNHPSPQPSVSSQSRGQDIKSWLVEVDQNGRECKRGLYSERVLEVLLVPGCLNCTEGNNKNYLGENCSERKATV